MGSGEPFRNLRSYCCLDKQSTKESVFCLPVQWVQCHDTQLPHKPSVSFIGVTRRKDFSSCHPQKTCQYCLSLVCSTAGHGSICCTGRSLVGKHTHPSTVVSLEVAQMRLWLLSHTKCDQSVVGNKRLGLGLSAEMTEPRNLNQTSRIGSNDPRNDVASRMICLFPPLV